MSTAEMFACRHTVTHPLIIIGKEMKGQVFWIAICRQGHFGN
jgi:hypothetical protein